MGAKGVDGEASSWCAENMTNIVIVNGDGRAGRFVGGDGDGSGCRRHRRLWWTSSAMMETAATGDHHHQR